MGIFGEYSTCNDPNCTVCRLAAKCNDPRYSLFSCDPVSVHFTGTFGAQVKPAPSKPAATPAVVAGLDPREKMKTINELHGSDILSRAESRYLLGIDEPAYVREVVSRSVAQRGVAETIAILPASVVGEIEKQIRERMTKALAGA